LDLAAAKNQLAKRLEIGSQRQLLGSDWQIVEFTANLSVDEAVALAKSNPAVESAEPNYLLHLLGQPAVGKRQWAVESFLPLSALRFLPPAFPNDPDLGNQWALQNTGQYGGIPGADVGAVEAWQMAQSRGTIVVAVIDTGVDYTHPDLVNRMWINDREIAGNGIDDDRNGFIDDVRGWNFAAGNNDPMDDHYHGTMVAGVMAAEANNGLGGAGVAGRAEVRVMPLKFFDSSAQGTTAAAIEAIDYAVRNGARIINASWGDTIYSQALFDAIRRSVSAECLVVAAAGNSASDNDRVPVYPGNFNSGPSALPAIISVTGTDGSDHLLNYANYGARSVDLAAPGNLIYSTMPGRAYGFISGTSLAAAMVSGVTALVWTQNPALSNEQVKQIVTKTVRAATATQGRTISGGIVQARGALAATPPYSATNTVASVSAADYTAAAIPSDSIVAAFGAKLGTGTEFAVQQPLPTSLAGSTVKVNGLAAPLFAVTPTQINFLLPPGLPNGTAEVVVTAGDGTISRGAMTITSVQPKVFTSNQSGSGAPAALWTRDGVSYFAAGGVDGAPIPVEAGGYLVLACTGLRHAPSTDGDGSNGVAESVEVNIGGVPAPILYAGAQGAYAGLDQVNLQLPLGLRGRGQVELVMTVAGKTANKVVISIK
jgi:uncharacterized protein (TIGR03437 family)